MNETLRTIDGRPVLRIERRLQHPPERVWRALTEPAELSRWYPFPVTGLQLRVGGSIRFDDGQGTVMDGVVTELDPPRVFAFSEHAPPEMEREGDDLVHFELRPDGDDGCLLIFTHTFDDRPAAASYASGWSGCLDVLQMVLDGRPVEWPSDMVERHEAYIEAFGLSEGMAESTADGWRVRFERQLMAQPVDAVWQALNPSAGDGAAPVIGGEVPPAFTTGEVAPGAVTEVAPPALLEYEWHSGGRCGGRVRWELSDGPAGARIVLTQTGRSESAGEQRVALVAWQGHIERLAEQLRAAGPPG